MRLCKCVCNLLCMLFVVVVCNERRCCRIVYSYDTFCDSDLKKKIGFTAMHDE